MSKVLQISLFIYKIASSWNSFINVLWFFRWSVITFNTIGTKLLIRMTRKTQTTNLHLLKMLVKMQWNLVFFFINTSWMWLRARSSAASIMCTCVNPLIVIMLSRSNYVSSIKQEMAIITRNILELEFSTTWTNFCSYYVVDKSLMISQ